MTDVDEMQEIGSGKGIVRDASGFLISIIGFALVIIFLILIFRGAVWLLTHVENWLLDTASRVSDVCVFVLCPLAIFRRTRRLAGFGFIISSYIFGTAWFGLCCLVVFSIWSYTGLILSLFVCVFPAAFVAAALHPDSVPLWPLVVGLFLTFGANWAGNRLSVQRSKTRAETAVVS